MGGSRKKQRDPADLQIVEQGRFARANSISREDAPHPDGSKRDLWLEGWDAENANREGSRG